jgi:hypothetical protein
MQSEPRLERVITTATGLAVLYLVGILWTLPLVWICALCSMSLGACIWMVVRILKDPWSIDRTFDNYFYQDRPDIRRVSKE